MPAGNPKSTVSGGPFNIKGSADVNPMGGIEKGPKRKSRQSLSGAGKGPSVGYFTVNPTRGNGAPVKGGAGTLSKGVKAGKVNKKYTAQSTFKKF